MLLTKIDKKPNILMFKVEFQGLDEKQVLGGLRSITLHDHI